MMKRASFSVSVVITPLKASEEFSKKKSPEVCPHRILRFVKQTYTRSELISVGTPVMVRE